MKKLFLLPLMALMLVGCGEKAPEKTEKTVTLTAESLLGAAGSNVAYSKEYAEKEVDGINFKYQQIGCYYDSKTNQHAGIQMRNKLADTSNGTKSNLFNLSAFGDGVKSVAFKVTDGKFGFDNANCLKVSFAKAADLANPEVQMLSLVKDQQNYTITPADATQGFLKLEIDDAFTFSLYFAQIVITYVG